MLLWEVGTLAFTVHSSTRRSESCALLSSWDITDGIVRRIPVSLSPSVLFCAGVSLRCYNYDRHVVLFGLTTGMWSSQIWQNWSSNDTPVILLNESTSVKYLLEIFLTDDTWYSYIMSTARSISAEYSLNTNNSSIQFPLKETRLFFLRWCKITQIQLAKMLQRDRNKRFCFVEYSKFNSTKFWLPWPDSINTVFVCLPQYSG